MLLPDHVLNQFSRLVKTLEIEQVRDRKCRCGLTRISVICAAHRYSNMMAVWETNNEIWIYPPANTDDLDLLSAERMILTGYGYESRRGLGRNGSLL